MLKNVLLVYIDYPPRIQSGGVRGSRLLRYLPDHGWKAQVLTMLHTPEHCDLQLGAPTQVHRVPGPHLARWSGLLRPRRPTVARRAAAGPAAPAPTIAGPRRFARYFVPDTYVFWIPHAIKAGLAIVRRHDIHVLYTSSPSESTLLVGFCLQRLTGLPWIVEFRDPWMLNPFRIARPFGWLECVERRLESMVVSSADQLIVTSEHYRDQLLERYPSLAPESVTWVSNGYDPDDYMTLDHERFDRFTIVHAGKFYGERSSLDFLRGLQLFAERRPDLAVTTQVVFIGTIDREGFAFIERAGLQALIQLRGVRPHVEALQAVAGADVNLLIPGPGLGTMPAKLFEQIAVGRPILALVDEGPAKAFIDANDCGLCIGAHDIDGIAKAIERLRGAGPLVAVDEALKRRYAYPDIARRVAEVLDNTLASIRLARKGLS